MPTHPDEVRRRITPDAVQVQVILGSLLGDGLIVGPPGARRLRIVHSADRIDYAAWKHGRLGGLIAGPLHVEDGRVWFETVSHPLFDDLAPCFHRSPSGLKRVRRERVLACLAPLGLTVWMTDLGRLRIHPDVLLPEQARLALSA